MLRAVPHPDPPRARPSVHAALVIVQLAFGSLAVEGKLAMSPQYGVSPAALAMARILGGALVFVPAHLLLGTARVRAWRDIAQLAVLALLGIVLNQGLYLAGLQRTSPLSATLLVAGIPVFTMIIAATARRGRLTLRGVAGIALALFGLTVLTGFALPGTGDSFVLMNSFSYSLYVVFSKHILARYGTVTVLAWTFGAGAVLFAPVGGVALVRDASSWSMPAIGLIGFIVLVPTALAYALNAWALRRSTPGLVTVYIYLQPVVTVVLTWLQTGRAPELRSLVAGALILSGVALVATAERQDAPAPG